MSSAFSWKPKGVSRTRAGRPRPTRENSSRWTLLMVGLVSPEPMMTSSRGSALAIRLQQQGSDPVRVLDVEVVVAREPFHPQVVVKSSGFVGLGPLGEEQRGRDAE